MIFVLLCRLAIFPSLLVPVEKADMFNMLLSQGNRFPFLYECFDEISRFRRVAETSLILLAECLFSDLPFQHGDCIGSIYNAEYIHQIASKFDANE